MIVYEKSYVMFEPLREFHNEVTLSLYKEYTKPVLLDLASGQGGDLHKWKQTGVKKVFAFDKNQKAINESRTRYKEIAPAFAFHVFQKDLSQQSILLHKKVDNVSCMFALHYFFKSEDTLMCVLETILQNLKRNGHFFGTMLDGALLHAAMPISQKHFKAEALSKIDKTSLYGNKIRVFQRSTVLHNDAIEYIIWFDLFVEKCKSVGLELVETKLFADFPSFKGLDDMNAFVSGLNRTFVFKKVF